ncbi:sensor histidine kinase [uncultured Imperialibacter sp.]|uniref:sensor histidine kinase n=1 Tax=uncultured Imperialibacter sp. TaxID=1672639 RepID=UPI0030D806F7
MKSRVLPRGAVYALHILFWVCYGAILFASLSNWEHSQTQIWITVISDVLTSSAIVYINFYWLLPKLYRRGKYTQYIVASVSLVVSLVFLRVNVLPLSHRSISYTYFIRSVPAFGFHLITTVIWFFDNLISASRREIELKNSQLDSELKFLKLQLSPHFLFNTLNNIYSMAYFSDKNTAPAILKLSEMMRHMIYEDQGKFIPLSREIKFMENFIELWRLKLDEKPTIIFRHTGVQERHQIAHLIFLVFLENAFKHGNTMNGTIDISLDITEGDVLHFCVSNDTITGNKTLEEKSGVGLTNVRKRLGLIYPEKHKLTLLEEPTSFTVNLTIDLQ